MREVIQRITETVRNFFATIEAIWTYAVFPLLGLLLWISLVTAFTKFSATDALLVVVAFSIWYAVWRIRDGLSHIEAYVAQILLRSVPTATSVTVITANGHKHVHFQHAEQVPEIVDP